MSTGKRLVHYALDYKKLLITGLVFLGDCSRCGSDGSDDCQANY